MAFLPGAPLISCPLTAPLVLCFCQGKAGFWGPSTVRPPSKGIPLIWINCWCPHLPGFSWKWQSQRSGEWERPPSLVVWGCTCDKHARRPVQFSSVQSLSRVQLFATPWIEALQDSLPITNSRSLLKPMSIESVMPSSHLILCRSLLLLPPVPPSIRVFSNESALWMRWPKYWSFSFSISPSNEHPGLISFRMDWLDILAVQGTLKSLLQHHSSKASIFRRSAFFTESAQTIHILLDNLEVVWACRGDNKGLTASKILRRFAIAWTLNELPS